MRKILAIVAVALLTAAIRPSAAQTADTARVPSFKVLSSYGYSGLFTEPGYVRGFSTHQTFLFRPVRYLGIGFDLAYAFHSAGPLTVGSSSRYNAEKEQYEFVPEHTLEGTVHTLSLGPALYWLPTVKEKHEFQIGLSLNVAYLGIKDVADEVLKNQVLHEHNCGFRLLAGAGYQYKFTPFMGLGFRAEYSLFRNHTHQLSGLAAYLTLGFEF